MAGRAKRREMVRTLKLPLVRIKTRPNTKTQGALFVWLGQNQQIIAFRFWAAAR